MTIENDWRRLAEDPAYSGGVVEDVTKGGNLRHRRISEIKLQDGSITFRMDRVAELKDGKWQERPPTEGDVFMWFPYPAMHIAFSPNGVATFDGGICPSYIECVRPSSDIPEESPLRLPQITN